MIWTLYVYRDITYLDHDDNPTVKGLRFYTMSSTLEIENLIDKAEAESYKTCESCGTKEEVASEGSWVTTLCKTCRKG